jgi:succinate dehydrogenase assembly factor 2
VPVFRTFGSSSNVKSSSPNDASTGVDPGYVSTPESRKQERDNPAQRPSNITDPFPLPFDPRLEGLSLSSEHQSDGLAAQHGAQEPIPLRVPGRDPGQETRDVKIARMIWQTRKRGTLETDLLLSTFATKELKQLSDAEVEEFDVVSKPT